jgi:hypothetical protein
VERDKGRLGVTRRHPRAKSAVGLSLSPEQQQAELAKTGNAKNVAAKSAEVLAATPIMAGVGTGAIALGDMGAYQGVKGLGYLSALIASHPVMQAAIAEGVKQALKGAGLYAGYKIVKAAAND